jgi:hypothetical protein
VLKWIVKKVHCRWYFKVSLKLWRNTSITEKLREFPITFSNIIKQNYRINCHNLFVRLVWRSLEIHIYFQVKGPFACLSHVEIFLCTEKHLFISIWILIVRNLWYIFQIASLINIGSNYLNAGMEARRHGTAHESIVPYQVYSFNQKESLFNIQ